MMHSNALLSTVTATGLTAPVRRMLQSDTAVVRDWAYTQLEGGAGNPVSLGLYRFSGTADDLGAVRTWFLILKLIQMPAPIGGVDFGAGEDPAHWNYWKREKFVYLSDLPTALPPGLVAPRCYGVRDLADGVIWLWLEEIQGLDSSSWSLERYCTAARHLGRFNGYYLSSRPLPDLPWLSRGIYRQFISLSQALVPRFFLFDDGPNVWDDPRVEQRYAPSRSNTLRRYLIEQERFLDSLDRIPQTLCHHDAYPTNLGYRHGTDGLQLVLFDWGLLGLGPVGADLAQLSFGAWSTLTDVDGASIDSALFASYLDGLYDVGWRGNELVVRFGYAASSVLRISPYLLFLLEETLKRSDAAEIGKVGSPASPGPGTGESFILARAEEAFQLLPAIF